MNKQDAIKKLQLQIQALNQLNATNMFSQHFIKWQRDTEITIEKIFGTSTRHLPDFRKITFYPGSYSSKNRDERFASAFQRGNQHAIAILKSMIGEIEEYWEPSKDINAYQNIHQSSETKDTLQVDQINSQFEIINPKIFISHIHEEAKIALVLKKYIELAFAGQCSVFVSSDSDDIPVGRQWLAEIDSALNTSKVLINICSPISIHRPWINFEMGCGWIKRIPIIPICHSGLKKNELPPPISRFQALEIDQKDFLQLLFSSLSKEFGFVESPDISYEKIFKDLKNAEKFITSSQYSTNGSKTDPVKI